MKHNILIYILSFLGFMAFSCNDETFIDNSGTDSGDCDGLTLSLKIDVPDIRTRAIDMTPGGTLYLNNIWIGVYNKSNGQRVVSDSVNLHSRLTESGVTLTDIIKIKVNQYINNTYGADYCVVGVANYYGIRTFDKTDLISALQSADTWDKFKIISIDTQQDFPNQTPVLMGYLTRKDNDESKHPVIDQLTPSNNNINISNQTNVFVKGTTTGSYWLTGFDTSGYIMLLRRLRAKININLTTRDDQMTITNLEYKVVNVPKSSFLAERRTNTFGNFQAGYQFSSNSADAKNEGYITFEEAEWQKITDNYSFSYEHFENKHWAKSDFLGVASDNFTEKYHERGEQSNGVFTKLASSASDWNNNASYIILRISLRDFSTGRNSIIEYTILEGFCNNSDGVSQVDANGNTSGSMQDRLKDFSCFRNTDYHYNIHINSVEEIYTTVTTEGSHPNDQNNGNIWQMLYPKFKETEDSRISVSNDATFSFKDPIDCTKDDENHDLNFEEIGFRLAGTFYDAKRQAKIPVDLCYNLAHGELDGFGGLWIDPINGVTEYFVDTRNEDSEGNKTGTSALVAMENYFSSGSHPDEMEMLSRFTVNADGNVKNPLNIVEFIKKLNLGEVETITGVNVKGIKLYETSDETDNPRNHMIGLYIFDRERSIVGGEHVKTDTKQDCHYYQIRAIEQYPSYLTKVNYERIFAVGNNGNRILSEGGTTKPINNTHNTNHMLFSDNPDIAFRLIGYYDKDRSGEYTGFYDLCYNFDMNEYTGFNNYMPAPSYDTKSISKNALTRENIPEELLNGIKIKEGENGTALTIKQFISRALSGNISSSKDYRFEFTSYGKKYYYNTDQERNNSIRGIYIFDKKDRYKQPVLYDPNTNSATYQIYAAEQDGLYVPPVQLPNPDRYNIGYTSKATYNIIEEILGEIKIPLLSSYNYGTDYCYKLITKDPSGKSMDKDCILETIMYQSNGIATFEVPMSVGHSDARNIFIQSISLNERLLDSENNNTVVAYTQSLTNPEWNFTTNDWYNIYYTWSTNPPSGSTNSSFRYFYGKEESFGSLTNNILPIMLSATGTNQIRGSIADNDRYIYINNSGCKVSIKIFNSCKVTIEAGYSDETKKEYDGRGIKVTAGEFSESLMYISAKGTYSTSEKISLNEGESLDLNFTITGSGGSNIYKIRLTD